jgi:hypothetical protein
MRLLICKFFLLIVAFTSASTAFAQASRFPEFIMTLSTDQKNWDTSAPLTVNVAIKNLGRKSFYLGLKCNFGFEGLLDHARQTSVRYLIKWDKGRDELCALTRADLIRIPARRTVNFKLMSVKVVKLGDVSWESHPVGEYSLAVRYGTSKRAPFNDVWLGATGTQYLKVQVK